MSTATDNTTLICLFHHYDQAKAALADIQEAQVSGSSISVISANQAINSGTSTLKSLGVPARDLHHLEAGVIDGGTVIAVSAAPSYVSAVERIFEKHKAGKIDETDTSLAPLGAAADGEAAIPVVEEELQVGKRTVDQGGVRVYRRVIEMPAEASINLRDEHVVVTRNAVDRPATQADLAAAENRAIELVETAEEAVISKNVRVVEEVLVGKEIGEHTQHIADTVRKTEVEVEQLQPGDSRSNKTRSL